MRRALRHMRARQVAQTHQELADDLAAGEAEGLAKELDPRFLRTRVVSVEPLREGAVVRATDPEAMERARAVFPGLCYSVDPYEVARGADALLLLTEWEQFRRLDWKRIRSEMVRALVIDARNMLRPAEMKALGFEYLSFGRPDPVETTASNASN